MRVTRSDDSDARLPGRGAMAESKWVRYKRLHHDQNRRGYWVEIEEGEREDDPLARGWMELCPLRAA